jgi:HlyD family secretion protein
MELRVAGSINVLPSQSADVRSQLEGIVQEVLVDEGQHVNVGDVIIRLVDRDVRSELQKTEGLIDESRARLRLLEAGSRAEEVELARTTVARFEEQLKFYRAKFERFELLNKQQLASMVDLEESKRLVASGESDLAEARKKLELLLAGSRPEEIEALRGMVASLETQRRNFAEQLRLMTVVSPSTGIVSTPSRQLREMRGQLVQKGDLITKVTDLRTITAEIAVSEKEIGDIRISQPVALKARAYPERIFSGKVTEIATTAQGAAAAASTAKAPVAPTSLAEAAKTANTILVTTEIDNSAELLKPGMTGMAKIYCGKRRIADLMMRRLSRTFRVEFWSWW